MLISKKTSRRMTSCKFIMIDREKFQIDGKKSSSMKLPAISRSSAMLAEYTASELGPAFHLTLERALPRIFSFACRTYDAALSLLREESRGGVSSG